MRNLFESHAKPALNALKCRRNVNQTIRDIEKGIAERQYGVKVAALSNRLFTEFTLRELPFQGPLTEWREMPQGGFERRDGFNWDWQGDYQKQVIMVVDPDGFQWTGMSYPTGRSDTIDLWTYHLDYYVYDWEESPVRRPFVASFNNLSPFERVLFALDWAKPYQYIKTSFSSGDSNPDGMLMKQ